MDLIREKRVISSIDIEKQLDTMQIADYDIWSPSKHNCPRTFTVTFTSTITEPYPTQCGYGIPRARSISESVITFTATAPTDMICPRRFIDASEAVPDLHRPPVDAPKCLMPISECSESWNYFNRTFADWNRVAGSKRAPQSYVLVPELHLR